RLHADPDGGWLAPEQATRLLACYGLDVAEAVPVSGADAAAEAATRVGLPAVLKVTGPVHKSDVGGVRLGLKTAGDVRDAYRDMAARIGAEMTGAIVQRMLPAGVEIIIGGVTYPVFGPLVMVGMGGVTADLLADRAFRVPPVDAAAAREMIGELRCAPLLHGYRGSPPADVEALAGQVARVSRLLEDLPQVAELDLNPVIVTPQGGTAVDVRVRGAPAQAPPSPPLRRLPTPSRACHHARSRVGRSCVRTSRGQAMTEPTPGTARPHYRTPAVIAAGGALGTGARYGANLLWPAPPGAFPWTTLTVNALGCLAIGVLL